MRQVDYYNKYITEGGFELAYDHYIDYCKEKGIKPELKQEDYEATGFDNLPSALIDHVVYHAAEFQGFDVDEEMI